MYTHLLKLERHPGQRNGRTVIIIKSYLRFLFSFPFIRFTHLNTWTTLNDFFFVVVKPTVKFV